MNERLTLNGTKTRFLPQLWLKRQGPAACVLLESGPETQQGAHFLWVTDFTRTPVNNVEYEGRPASFSQPSLLPGRRACSSLGVVVVKSRGGSWSQSRHGWLRLGCRRHPVGFLVWKFITHFCFAFLKTTRRKWEARWWSPQRRAQRKCQKRRKVSGLTCQ